MSKIEDRNRLSYMPDDSREACSFMEHENRSSLDSDRKIALSG